MSRKTQSPPKSKPEVGQTYRDARTDDLSQILYCDQQVVFLREESTKPSGRNHHRQIPRSTFNSHVESGRYKLKPDSSLDLLGSEAIVDWTEVPHIGDQTNKNLHNAGYSTLADVATASVNELTDVAGVGTVAANNLIRFAS